MGEGGDGVGGGRDGGGMREVGDGGGSRREGGGAGESGEGGHVARAAWLYWTVVSLNCAVLLLHLAVLRVFSEDWQSNIV